MTASPPEYLQEMHEQWAAAWTKALETWSRYTRLRAPVFCLSHQHAAQEGLTESFAMIRLADLAVVINLRAVKNAHVSDLPVEVLAHEIGHHVLAPANLTDHARLLARIRRGLPTIENEAPMVANLYTDLLINDRLQRSAGLRMDEVYRRMNTDSKPGSVWRLYMRIYENLWRLDPGTLSGTTGEALDGDALLGARLIRAYARDWMAGAGRFACLLLPYLLKDKDSAKLMAMVHDTRCAGEGGEPDGLTNLDPDELDGIIHPALDPALADELDSGDSKDSETRDSPENAKVTVSSQGQARQPFEYGQLLRAAGLTLSDHDVAVRYYREQARPHLVPFPSLPLPATYDVLPEGLEAWNLGDPLDALDWMQSILTSPQIVPGLTTMRRVYGTEEGDRPRSEPIDLDIYIDSSGSMANPQHSISYPALAGAIICLSALRAGSRVQATLWSGTSQFTSTPGFVREEDTILRVMTGYFGGATAFPIHVLRKTFAKRTPADRPVHILIISDDGVNTLFFQDELANSGWDISAMALENGRGGGTMVLNLYGQWETYANSNGAYRDIKRARDEQGWDVHSVSTWDQLVDFARAFSQRQYGDERRKGVHLA